MNYNHPQNPSCPLCWNELTLMDTLLENVTTVSGNLLNDYWCENCKLYNSESNLIFQLQGMALLDSIREDEITIGENRCM